MIRSLLVSIVGISGLSGWVGGSDLDYHEDIAPLLRQYCAGCHNDDDYDGGFSVEYFADVEYGGDEGGLLEPGDPEASRLIQLMTGGTKDPMPPADEPQPTEADLAIFREWIEAGAVGPDEENDISILTMLTVPEIPGAKGVRAITALARSDDGKRVAVARFGLVELLDSNGQSLQVIEGLPGKVNRIEFASGSRDRWVTASGIAGLKGVATVWEGSEKVGEFGEGYHRDILYDATFSPDGQWLATAGYDARIALWDLATGRKVRSIEVHNGAIFDLAFSPDGSVLASASGDQTVKLWRVSDGVRLDTLNQPQAEQLAVAFSPDGKFIFAAGADNRIRKYRFISRKQPKINPLIHSRFAHEDAIVAMVLSDDGRWLATASDDHTVKVWSLPGLTHVESWPDQPDVISSLAFTGDRQLLAASLDGSTRTKEFKKPVAARQTAAGKGYEGAPAMASVSQVMPEVMTLEVTEQEDPVPVSVPFEVSGKIEKERDTDSFTFSAKAGEEWIFEVTAAGNDSKLDSRLEILTAEGLPLEQVKLQATRDSWFTFRGKNSTQVNDFRVHNWREMELNEYLYCNGEVVKLWLYPRGPDSGFTVYPGMGTRYTYFNTSALTHALGEPCYVVEPVPPGREPVPNGLPVFSVYYENDDDPMRRKGDDSVLRFKAPSEGNYQVRISDVRGFGGEGFHYELKARPPRPGFTIKHNMNAKKGLTVAPGTGREFLVTADRIDGFQGEIRVELTGLPKGFTSQPVTIEAGQIQAAGMIFAPERTGVGDLTAEDQPQGENPKSGESKGEKMKEMAEVQLVAMAAVGREEKSVPVGSAFPVSREEVIPELKVAIHPDGESGNPQKAEDGILELEIRPGETITAIVKAERIDFKDRITFGKENSGRNLAHGLIIDNIGLNGLMIPESKSEQRFFITASKWVPESVRTFHLKTGEGGITTEAIRIRVLPPAM